MARELSNVKMTALYLDHLMMLNRPKSTIYTYKVGYEAFMAYLGTKHFSHVEVADVERYASLPMKQARRDRPAGSPVSPGTKRRRMAEVSSLFSWLHKRQHLLRNVCSQLDYPDVSDEDPNPIDRPAWIALWGSDLEDADRVAYGAAFFWSLRRVEVTRLGKTQFQGEMVKQVLRKGQRLHNVPWLSNLRFFEERDPELIGGSIDTMLEPLYRLLNLKSVSGLLLDDWLPRVSDQWIDPTHFNRHLDNSMIALGRDGEATPHMLRHGFFTYMLELGMPPEKAARLGNHKDLRTLMRYVKTKEDPTAAELDGDESNADILQRFTRY